MISGVSRFAHIQNQARANGQNVSDLARLYGLERMLARIAASDYVEDFVLRGGVLPAAFALRRPIKDIDLGATRIANDVHDVDSRVREIATIALDDGIEFKLDSGGDHPRGRSISRNSVKLIGLVKDPET